MTQCSFHQGKPSDLALAEIIEWLSRQTRAADPISRTDRSERLSFEDFISSNDSAGTRAGRTSTYETEN